MRRALLALVVGAVLIMATVIPAAARSWRWDECRFRNYSGGAGFNRTEITLLVRCGARAFPVPGGPSKALAVMDCESSGSQFAGTTHIGLFQFAPSTFDSVMDRWSGLWHRWGVKPDPWNARSNALAAIRKASADGWGAWSCA